MSLLLVLLAAMPAYAGWVTTWSTAVAQPYADPTQLNNAHLVFNNQTLREIVHTSIGSDTVRVRISNVFGNSAIEIGAAHIALNTTASGIDPTTDHVLTFSGRTDVTLPLNAMLISDPIAFSVPAAGNLVISLFFPNPTNGAAVHYSAAQTNYIGAGDQTSAGTISKGHRWASGRFWQGLTSRPRIRMQA